MAHALFTHEGHTLFNGLFRPRNDDPSFHDGRSFLRLLGSSSRLALPSEAFARLDVGSVNVLKNGVSPSPLMSCRLRKSQSSCSDAFANPMASRVSGEICPLKKGKANKIEICAVVLTPHSCGYSARSHVSPELFIAAIGRRESSGSPPLCVVRLRHCASVTAKHRSTRTFQWTGPIRLTIQRANLGQGTSCKIKWLLIPGAEIRFETVGVVPPTRHFSTLFARSFQLKVIT